jgi:hypothetical protein
MTKKSKKPISEREKARRKAAAEAASAAAHEPPPEKFGGKDLHANVAKARIIRHQGR